MAKRNFSKRQLVIFILSIVIGSISLLFISVLFSFTVTDDKKTPTGSTTVTPTIQIVTTSAPVIEPSGFIDREGDPKIQPNIQVRFKDYKTISGNLFTAIYKLPYKYSDWVIINISDTNSNKFSINMCQSKYYEKETPSDYQDQIKKALESLDLKFDGNSYDTSVDQSC